MMADMGLGLAWLVLASTLGLALALGCGVLLLQGRRIPPVATASAVALVAASGTITGLLERWDWDPADVGVMRIVAMTTAVARLLAWLPTGATAVTLLLILAIVGARARPHRPRFAVLAGLGALVTAIVVAAGGYVADDMMFSTVRAFVYLVFGGLVAVALLGGSPEEGNAPEAGAAAGLVFPLVVAAGEGARRGLVEAVLLVQNLSRIELANRELVVRGYFDAVAGELPWSAATLGCSLLVGVVGISANLQGGSRSRGALAGVIVLGLAPLILLFGDNGVERLVTLANAIP